MRIETICTITPANSPMETLPPWAATSGARKIVPTAAFGTVFNDNRQNTLDERTYLDLVYQHEFVNQLNVKHGSTDRYYYRAHPAVRLRWTGTPPFTINKDRRRPMVGRGNRFITKRAIQQPQSHDRLGVSRPISSAQSNADIAPTTYLDDKRRSILIAAYLQDEWGHYGPSVLTAGVRHDQYSTFGGTTNPRAGLISTWDKTTVKLLYGQAFRAPNSMNSFMTGSTSRANADIKPGTHQNLRTSGGAVPGGHLRALGSLYQYNIAGLISQTTDPVDGKLFYSNVDNITGPRRGIGDGRQMVPQA